MTSTVYQDAIVTYGSRVKAARAMGMPRMTFSSRLKQELKKGVVHTGKGRQYTHPGLVDTIKVDVRGEKADGVTLPQFPRKHLTDTQLLDRLERESELRNRRMYAERWFKVHVHDKKPIACWWFGDPHIGALCDIKRLRRDVNITADTPGLYGCNIGDVADNWVGSLMRIAAEQDISRQSERRLALWFLRDSGVCWLLWIHGNHDEWNDSAEFYSHMNIQNHVVAESVQRREQGAIMLDWAARMKLVFPKGGTIKVHAAHDFPGHSMWNPTHGMSRAPRMLGNGADLYIGGHKHTFGTQQFEMPEADLLPLSIRLRGYKRWDPHSRRLGFPDDKHGCGAMTIFDPTSKEGGRILTFIDIEQGRKVLKAMRGEEVTIHAPRAKPVRKPTATKAKASRRKRHKSGSKNGHGHR